MDRIRNACMFKREFRNDEYVTGKTRENISKRFGSMLRKEIIIIKENDNIEGCKTQVVYPTCVGYRRGQRMRMRIG